LEQEAIPRHGGLVLGEGGTATAGREGHGGLPEPPVLEQRARPSFVLGFDPELLIYLRDPHLDVLRSQQLDQASGHPLGADRQPTR
jgi:hypothetical protein